VRLISALQWRHVLRGVNYAQRASAEQEAQQQSELSRTYEENRPVTSAKSNLVLLCGVNNVFFEPVQPLLILKALGITAQTFRRILYDDVQQIPESEIPGAQKLPKSSTPPLIAAWVTGNISCQQAKDIVLKHRGKYSLSFLIAQKVLNAQDLVKYIGKKMEVY
jgi:hypothetical protein